MNLRPKSKRCNSCCSNCKMTEFSCQGFGGIYSGQPEKLSPPPVKILPCFFGTFFTGFFKFFLFLVILQILPCFSIWMKSPPQGRGEMARIYIPDLLNAYRVKILYCTHVHMCNMGTYVCTRYSGQPAKFPLPKTKFFLYVRTIAVISWVLRQFFPVSKFNIDKYFPLPPGEWGNGQNIYPWCANENISVAKLISFGCDLDRRRGTSFTIIPVVIMKCEVCAQYFHKVSPSLSISLCSFFLQPTHLLGRYVCFNSLYVSILYRLIRIQT